METKKKDNVLVGFIKYFYGNFVVLLLGFVSLPLTTRVLDAAEYGKTSMFSSAVSVIYIFAILGLDQTYIRYYYKDSVNRKKLFYQCLIPSFTLISVAVVV